VAVRSWALEPTEPRAGKAMKRFFSAVAGTLAAGILGGWLLQAVPTFSSARVVALKAAQASAGTASALSGVALVVACLCVFVAVSYAVFRWRWGAIADPGLWGPVLGAGACTVLLYAGLRVLASASPEGLYLIAAGVVFMVWTASAVRRSFRALFAI
jgi:hypothetical protein